MKQEDAVIVLTAALLFAPGAGIACSCAPQSGNYERYVLDSLCAADAVFVGDVQGSIRVRDFAIEYKIWPRESFKGHLQSPAFALTEVNGSCGYRFSVGGRYLIFADRHDDSEYVTTTACGLTQLLDSDGLTYQVLSATKGNIEQVCGEEAVEERRLERLREKAVSVELLEEETRELLNSDE